MLFIDLINQHYTLKQPYWAVNTFDKYEQLRRNYIVPVFRGIECTEINPDLLELKSIALQTTIQKECKNLPSQKTVRNIFYILEQVIIKGQKKGLIPLFEYEFQHVRSQREIEPRVQIALSKEDQIRMIKYMDEQTLAGDKSFLVYSYPVLVALSNGLRLGETAGLKWDDFDFENKTVSIKRNVSYCGYKNYSTYRIHVVAPKTKTSIRTVPINDSLCNKLLNFKTEYNLSGFCFPSVIDFKPNSTFSTSCIEAGFSPKTVSQLLGHASVKTTLDLYVHPL